MKLKGKIAIVTGGSDGIGRATAFELARGGCAVTVCAREPGRLDATARALEAAGAQALALAGDMGDPAFPRRLVEATVDTFGGVDILVNNAAAGLRARVQTMAGADLDRLLAVNLYGPLHLIQAALPALRAQRSGAIVNVLSIVVERPSPGVGGYTATKHALLGLGRTLRIEVLRDGIDVINVYPGLTLTGFESRMLRTHRRERRGPARWLSVPPERVAVAIREAIRRRRTEVWVTKRDRVFVALNRLAPGLFDRLLAVALRR